MSLIQCPECGKPNVSNAANACPSCGFPIKKYFKDRQDQISSETNIVHRSQQNNGCRSVFVVIAIWICTILAFLCILLALIDEDHSFQFILYGLFIVFLGIFIFNFFAPKELKSGVAALQEQEMQNGCKCPNCGKMAGHKMLVYHFGRTYQCANCKYMW